jgi:hypothetical protein
MRPALEQYVAALQKAGQVVQVQRLEIATDVEHDIPGFGAQRVDLLPGPEMVIHVALLARPGCPRVVEDQRPQVRCQIRIEAL